MIAPEKLILSEEVKCIWIWTFSTIYFFTIRQFFLIIMKNN